MGGSEKLPKVACSCSSLEGRRPVPLDGFRLVRKGKLAHYRVPTQLLDLFSSPITCKNEIEISSSTAQSGDSFRVSSRHKHDIPRKTENNLPEPAKP